VKGSQLYASLVCVAVVAFGCIAYSQVGAQSPGQSTALAAETSDVATLPPAGPHWAFVMAALSSGANVVDADSKDLKVLGLVPINRNGLLALSRDASRAVFV